MRIETFLKSGAETAGARTAIVAGGRAHSYERIRQAAQRVAAALNDRGVGRGDRVAVLMDNSFAAVVVTFGILMAGGVVCTVDREQDGEALARVLDERGAVALATEARFASLAAEALAKTSHVRVVLLSGGGRASVGVNCISFEDIVNRIGSAREIPSAGSREDDALVLSGFNDGDDHAAKPITLTHGELIAAAEAAEPGAGLTLRSIFSFAGFCHLVQAIRIGATVVLDASSGVGSVPLLSRPGWTSAGQPIMTSG
jgi:acyl-CoA synthetase (AMP-forming)/AMP-acid ligase II